MLVPIGGSYRPPYHLVVRRVDGTPVVPYQMGYLRSTRRTIVQCPASVGLAPAVGEAEMCRIYG